MGMSKYAAALCVMALLVVCILAGYSIGRPDGSGDGGGGSDVVSTTTVPTPVLRVYDPSMTNAMTEVLERLDALIVLQCRELDTMGADSLTQEEVEACR